ncbi:DUF885 domain-containing protein [Sphingomonas jatrophae]|uniref:Uncharacterized conserved protein, DUF885 familyt n=1 Tax=Sphingomonas jatrophae TaxID=1166337 RepID=A0A1I6K133_9SPHN|nr:DUF885 family protein [Sphingomonas jatrophae]SFR84962.1 Uncharacterized conserved protein, DUF885 familyt [Sphingomonas jatrophae]
MDRRQFLASAGAAALATTLSPAAAFAQAPSDPKVAAELDRIFQARLRRSPELATSLGLDKGALSGLRGQLDAEGRTAAAERLAENKAARAALAKFASAKLNDADRGNIAVIDYWLETQIAPREAFGIESAIRPYRLFQQGGAYFATPDFLNSAHTIDSAADAEAYLARLDQFGPLLDTETGLQREEAARGFVAPAWSLDLTLGQMRKLRGRPAAESTLAQSLATRAQAKGVAGDWQARAAKIVEGKVYPALDRQIALVEQLKGSTAPGDGLWRLRQGDAIYAMALAQATTTSMTPDEVHRAGLEQVAEISGRLDTILKGQGLTKGSVGERLVALNKSPAQLYANSEAGRAELLAGLNEGVAAMQKKLPQAFATLPTQPLEIRAVPVEIQDGASNGYYRTAALDGSRPAIYFINLKDVGDWPKYTLPALSYHEGVPGHHLQLSLTQEAVDMPMLRKIIFLSAYGEGWALYAEEVAKTLGGYAGPVEEAGYLQSFLFRAARLVVDTGIHAKRWTREQATDYLVKATGFAQPRSQREVERYCTQAGQACSYKIGHMAWARARAKAEAALGPKFDARQFHEILKEGAMPLTLFDARVDARIAAMRA